MNSVTHRRFILKRVWREPLTGIKKIIGYALDRFVRLARYVRLARLARCVRLARYDRLVRYVC